MFHLRIDSIVLKFFSFFLFCTALAAQSITVTEPSAGKVICAGQTITIRWVKSGSMLESVKLRLYTTKGIKVLDIVNATANSGAFSWKVPLRLASAQYTIRVRTVDNAVMGDSKPFTVKTCTSGAITRPGPGNVVVPPPQGGNVSTPKAKELPAVTLNRDFELKSLGWNYGGGLHARLANKNSAPFNGVLTFRIRAIGHDNHIDIPVSLPPNGEIPIDLVFSISERELFDFGGRDTVVVTANPNRFYNETNMADNTRTHTIGVNGITAWIERLELTVLQNQNYNGPYPVRPVATVTVTVKGNGRIRVDVNDVVVGQKTLYFDINSPHGYGTYSQTVNMTPLQESKINALKRDTKCGPNSFYWPWQARLWESLNPTVRGVLLSNIVDGCYY